MNCVKCSAELYPDSIYCHKCGKKQVKEPGTGKKRRGNGQGSAYKPAGSPSWIAVKTIGYEPKEDGSLKQIVAKKAGFKTKSEALEYLPNLGKSAKKIDNDITFKGIYELWLPEFQKRGRTKSTENNYKAAMKHYKDIWYIQFADIGIDDLQECLDDCPKGKRTRQMMKAFAGLLYKYAIPRGYVEDGINKAHYLFVLGEDSVQRGEFKENEIELLRESIGKTPFAEYIYCNIYLGFRPNEFITLDIANYDSENKCFVAGEKTEAGRNRTVTVSPKIQPIIDDKLAGKESGPVFPNEKGNFFDLKTYREVFYLTLEQLGLPTPRTSKEGGRKLTPHCCRHTFATLMKKVQAADKDKLSLIGHTSVEMLQHYQHTNLDDLRKITNQL